MTKLYSWRLAHLMLLTAAGWLTSCIDDYELPEHKDYDAMLVINGQIVSGEECLFTLRSTLPTSGTAMLPPYVPGAKVQVLGTDGQMFEGHEVEGNQGHYLVQVGELSPTEKYYVTFTTRLGTYNSEPMQPLDAPEISELTYEQPREDGVVDLLVSTSDPQGAVCLLWQVDEYWEIKTPLESHWEYRLTPNYDIYGEQSPGEFVKLKPEEYTNHGWRHNSELSTIGTNDDYGNGAIARMCILKRSNMDHRFRTRYCARITQMAMTREEYEYRHLQQKLTATVGSLFTPMPSQLPSNIHRVETDFYMGASSSYLPTDELQIEAIGYVGVRGRVGRRDLYIDREDVGYESNLWPKYVPEEQVSTPRSMVLRGYQVADYQPETDEARWTDAWCVDYRSYFWGGGEALEGRPIFWDCTL